MYLCHERKYNAFSRTFYYQLTIPAIMMVYDVRTSARSRSGVLVSSLAVVAALEKYLKKYYYYQ